jgi:hypothetical protein
VPKARLVIGLLAAGLIGAAVPLHRPAWAGTGNKHLPGRNVSSRNVALTPTGSLSRGTTNKLRMLDAYGKLPLTFEANRGQTDPRVQFLARGRGYTLFVTATEAVLALQAPATRYVTTPGTGHPQDGTPRAALALAPLREPMTRTAVRRGGDRSAESPHVDPAVVRLQLVGARTAAPLSGLEELRGKRHYFLSNDPRQWHTQIPTYAKVRYQEAYPGIDLIYYGHQHELEYDFVVAPGADPTTITLRLDGARQLRIDANGDLVGQVGAGRDAGPDPEVRWHKPVVYQAAAGRTVQKHCPADLVGAPPADAASGQTFLEGRYVLKGDDQVAFAIAVHDPTRPLIIDPVLSYATYLGGRGDDGGFGIAVDGAGNAYVTGSTSSTDFPTSNPQQPTIHGVSNAFVAKLDLAGTTLLYATYLGGSGADSGGGIAVDSAGNAYVTGSTSSTDFPTSNPLQPRYGGGSYDAFVAALDPAGATLLYATYLGGSGIDAGLGIAVDNAGNAYVTGLTSSGNFPTSNPLQPTYGGGSYDAFVAALDPAGVTLLYATYLGGSGSDEGFGITVDSGGSAYVTGSTSSEDFPTSSPLQPTIGGGSDAFVAALDPTGATLRYATYLGGSADDGGQGIAVDSAGNAYVTGQTFSSNFPTSSPLQPTNHGAFDAFVAALDPAGATLLYATYLGGSGYDFGNGISVDSAGNAYVIGTTTSDDFPTSNPVQPMIGGFHNAFVAALDSVGATLLYATYLGGSSLDYGQGIAVDGAGNAWATGRTDSTNFPTSNPLQPTNHGGFDIFVAKISP